MKRLVIGILVFSVALLGAAKLSVVVLSNQMLSSLKQDFVPYGSLQYGKVKTSLSEGTIDVLRPSFTEFSLKQRFDAERARIDFGSSFDLVIGLINAANNDFSNMHRIDIFRVKTSLFDEGFHQRLDNKLETSSELWLGWLSCDGKGKLDQSHLSGLGLSDVEGDITVELARNSSDMLEFSFDVVTQGMGRSVFKASQGADAAHILSELTLEQVRFAENGYFRRLFVACPPLPGVVESSARVDDIINGWLELLSANSLRVNAESQNELFRFMNGGGELVLDVQHNQTSSNAVEGEVHGWLDSLPSKSLALSQNSEAAVELQVQSYRAPPETKVTPTVSISTPEPQYVEAELDMVEALVDRRIRVLLLNDKSYEGILNGIDEHSLTIIPLNGDGKVSYTLKRQELSSLEVWK